MSEEQRVTGLQVGLDRLRVDLALDRIGHEDHDEIGFGRGRRRVDDAQTGLFGLGATLRTLGEADADVDT